MDFAGLNVEPKRMKLDCPFLQQLRKEWVAGNIFKLHQRVDLEEWRNYNKTHGMTKRQAMTIDIVQLQIDGISSSR